MLGDYNDLKVRLNREYEEQADVRRNYQQEVETLLRVTSKIKEYVMWTRGVFCGSLVSDLDS